jgi:predicted alpha-1,6-mannanase (GH76 family)
MGVSLHVHNLSSVANRKWGRSAAPALRRRASRPMRFLGAFLLLCALGVAVTTLPVCQSAALAEDNAPTAAFRAQAATDALQQWYTPQSGLYRTTGWWNSGNAITALANFSRVSGTKKYLPVFANTLKAAQTGHDGAKGFINTYYDDEGWWALAWIDVYDLTHDPAYLRMADSIFSDMQLGWDTASCGGGVWWSKDTKEKNAIENELFLSVAASLANREPDAARRASDLAWAEKEWTWFRDSGMINGDHLINDGLDHSDPAHCKNNGKNTWTYNQGVILGGLVELDKAAPDPALKTIGSSIALAAITHLTDKDGVLHESNDAHTGGDVPQFKGIFARNLMTFNSASPDPRYQAFFLANARSLWKNDRDEANHFGFYWAGPLDSTDAARQSSALDLLIAADAVESGKGKRGGSLQGRSGVKLRDPANPAR